MAMESVITAKIPAREKELVKVVEWASRKAREMVREMAARMEMAVRTGLGLSTKKQILQHMRNPKSRIKTFPLSKKPEYSYFRGYFGFHFFSNALRNDGTGTGRRAYHSKQNSNSIPC